MAIRSRLLVALFLLCCGAGTAAAQTVVTIGSGFNQPSGVAVDTSGNLFIADTGNNAIKEILAADSYTTPATTLGSGVNAPTGVAVDSSGNVFVADTANSAIREIAAGGGGTVTTIATGSGEPGSLALDKNGNAFFQDRVSGRFFEALAAGGYATVKQLTGPFATRFTIAVDGNDNIFYTDDVKGQINEILAASNYATIVPIGSGFQSPGGIALDSFGNVFVGDFQAGALYEVKAAGGYSTVVTIASNAFDISQIAVDSSNNLFVSGFEFGPIFEFLASDGYANPQQIPLFVGFFALDANDNIFGLANDAFEALASSGYKTTIQLPGFYEQPDGIALDAAGNVFVADGFRGGLQETLAAGGYATVQSVANSGLSVPSGVAVDAAGNLFVADTGNSAIKEFSAAGGYSTVTLLGSGFNQPAGVAVDAAGNVFVADTDNSAVKEILAAGGYTTVQTLGPGIFDPVGIAVDHSGDIFVTAPEAPSALEVLEIVAVNGAIPASPTVLALGSGFASAQGVAVDASGNVFVADSITNTVKEILAVTPSLVAAILPSARAVQIGTPATVFATMINGSAGALNGCQPALPPSAPATLSLSYQTTDPVDNTPTGTPNTPVAIAGNGGSQSFVLGLLSTAAYTTPELPLIFSCTGAAPAPVIQGVDTLALVMSPTPVADIILAAQTPTANGVLQIAAGADAGAFAVASTNHGASDFITVSTDTGGAAIGVSLQLCQTVPSSGACINPLNSSTTLHFDAGAINTFSIFVNRDGVIPLAPASSRIFVRFTDGNGVLHGLVSVAVEGD
jgi:sugar lactone lactonase YvrE